MADTDKGAARNPLVAPGVIVTGMHRSGTSGVTRALHLMGLAIPKGDDLMGPTPDNRAGHFESRSLTALNDELLLALGGTWSGPPELPAGWETGDVAEPFLEKARDAFAGAYPKPRQWVWKDPRTSLTLPLWDRALASHPVVAVIRRPDEVAASLAARNGHQVALGLALWSRYVRTMLTTLAGRPVFLAPWDRVLADPVAWGTEVAHWLSGRLPRPMTADEAAGAIDPSIRPEGEGAGLAGVARSNPDLGSDDRELYERLRESAGPHETFPVIDAGSEPAFVAPLLEERRRADLTLIDHRDAAAAERAVAGRHIERLRAEIERQRTAREGSPNHRKEVAEYVRHLEVEIRRLKAALEERPAARPVARRYLSAVRRRLSR